MKLLLLLITPMMMQKVKLRKMPQPETSLKISQVKSVKEVNLKRTVSKPQPKVETTLVTPLFPPVVPRATTPQHHRALAGDSSAHAITIATIVVVRTNLMELVRMTRMVEIDRLRATGMLLQT